MAKWLLIVAALCIPPAQATASALGPVINEFVANHTGTDTNEFVEIFGAPDTDLSSYTILEIEGDGGGAGVIDGVFPVGTTDANGFWTTAFFNNMIENGSMTLLLVDQFSGTQGTDLDTDNDGNLDSMPWVSVVDGVAVTDGGASDHTYAGVVLAPGFDGIPFTPGGASRIPDGNDTDSVNDWVRNDFDGDGLPGFPGTPSVDEARNTPGASNQLVTPAADPIINEFVADHVAGDTHEFVEIFGAPNANYSRFRIVEIEGDGTNAGRIDATRVVGTADAAGFWVTNFMSGVLENGSMTLLLVENYTGSTGQDLDTDNDGTLDLTPWGRLVDDVAILNGGASDHVYSSTILKSGFDGHSDHPGGASRIPNGTDTDNMSDWFRNDYDGEGLPGFVGTPEDHEALNTPGSVNEPVADIEPPQITVDLNRTVLWPPNHKLVDICADVQVSDNRDPLPTFVLGSIASSEPDNGRGDGNTTDDIQGAEVGTPDVKFRLRSERQGTGNGREYIITYTATDASGNSASMTVAVRVPHDQSGSVLASVGYAPDGTGFEDGYDRFAIVIPSVPTRPSMDIHGNLIWHDGFDATEIDAHHVYVGNTAGAFRPQETAVIDVTGDGLTDLALYFSVDEARELQARIVPEDENNGRVKGEKKGATDGPIGLHFEAPDGAEHKVTSIFDLGAPVELLPVMPPLGSSDPTSELGPTGRVSVDPNPFNPATTISFELEASARVSVRIFDVAGRLLRTLASENLGAGPHRIDWDGRDDLGRQVSSGIYFVRFEWKGYRTTRKAVMLK